ncbi:MAG: Gfo/Idh/MocA family protein [Longimicrobiales bacterium]
MTPPRHPRIGVAGVGALGCHHARILAGLDGVSLSGIHDVRPERAREVAHELGTTAMGSLEALLDASDALVVAVPTRTHEEVAVAALLRGIPVLVEKPLAPTLHAADRILAAAGEGGAFVQTGHVERFNAAVLAALPFLDRPLFIESHRMAPFTPRSTDVAVVLDLMIHDVDLVMSLVGMPLVELAASGLPVLTSSVDIANARLTFAGGAVANLTASRVSRERMRKLRIFQPSGYLSLNLAEGTGEFLRLRQDLSEIQARAAAGPAAADLSEIVERVTLEGDGAEPLRRELENFRDAVRGNAAPAVTGDDGRAALAVALAIQERIADHVADTRPA